MKKIVFILGLFISGIGFAQEVKITGRVLDGEVNNEPLAFSSITIKETKETFKTNFDGIYSIQVSPGTYTLVFDFIGYEPQEVNNVVIKNSTINIDNKILFAKQISFENSLASKG